jgi:hypothetical protein
MQQHAVAGAEIGQLLQHQARRDVFGDGHKEELSLATYADRRPRIGAPVAAWPDATVLQPDRLAADALLRSRKFLGGRRLRCRQMRCQLVVEPSRYVCSQIWLTTWVGDQCFHAAREVAGQSDPQCAWPACITLGPLCALAGSPSKLSPDCSGTRWVQDRAIDDGSERSTLQPEKPDTLCKTPFAKVNETSRTVPPDHPCGSILSPRGLVRHLMIMLPLTPS